MMFQLAPAAALSRGSVAAVILGFGEIRPKLGPVPALSRGSVVAAILGLSENRSKL